MNTDTVKATNKDLLKQGYASIKMYVPAIIGLIALFVIGQILAPGFAAVSNIATIVATACVLVVASTGQSFVIMAGNFGIDMSLGAIMNVGAIIVPMVTGGGNENLWLAIIILLAVGMLIGLINGLCIHFFKIPALAMTLIMTYVVNGAVVAITEGKVILSIPSVLKSIGRPVWGEFRWIMMIALVFVVVIQLVLKKTRYGKSLLLAGSNRNAAKLVGINVNRTVLTAYVLGGMFAAFAGMMLLGYVGNAQLQMANEYTMMSVAAAVIGGVKLAGGYGDAIGITLGSIVIVALSSVLVAVGLNIGMQTFFEGLILLLIVLLNNRGKKYRV